MIYQFKDAKPMRKYQDQLDFIGRVLDAWDDEKDGKILVSTEFVVVAFFVVLVCFFLHASKGVNSSHVSS